MNMFGQFQQIEHNFNRNYMMLLHNLKGIVTGDEDETSCQQFKVLSHTYTSLFTLTQDNLNHTELCERFYKTVDPRFKLLMTHDESIFNAGGEDLFTLMFNQEGIDSVFLYNQLSEGFTDAEVYVECDDAKKNLWDALIGLYRLSMLICVYLKMPIVKEIIDIILSNNPDLTQQNLCQKIMRDFQGKRTLRRLVMQLLKSKEDHFSEIFSSLQKIVASFASKANTTTPPTDNEKDMDLGNTMQNMMNAISSGSEQQMQEALKQSGGLMDIKDFDLSKLQEELEEVGQETESN